MTRSHGGPDAQGPARFDFSTNANACGPCPEVVHALRVADPTRYPDPHYTALRHALADWHGVAPGRLVFAASASEFIMRITAVGARRHAGPVAVPPLAYGDYAAAALAHGRPVVHTAQGATLVWHADPSSPTGEPQAPGVLSSPAWQVLDAAYDPLRLEGTRPWPRDALDAVFQLCSPNKALGLTGVRGAYAIAPRGAEEITAALEAAAPSWPLGAHAVAMLSCWPTNSVQRWLAASRNTLRGWMATQRALFVSLGCTLQPSVANFFCARWPGDLPLDAMRAHGISLRDCTSFGLPGWVRASAQPPAAQQAVAQAVAQVRCLYGAPSNIHKNYDNQ